ncbi:MAG TPA: DUF2235 domain-containing protein [Allosphingosinicella sp.]|jgi:uncharacterized protein (DUF2235 family)
MKRIIFCFDGTWNRLHPDLATNVVLTAASIERMAGGTAQIIHYDEGVGTNEWETVRGGVFGTGLIENVREAYRFLCFNYDPGDEIYVFGFSRGAFSARTFIGFLRHVGPLRRLHIGRIDEALELYQDRKHGKEGAITALRKFRADYAGAVCIGEEDEAWRCANVGDYQAGSAPQLRIRYLGVWDTVGALGVPELLPGSDWFNREHDFHDASLDRFVESARHAVAIDERRRLFPPVPLGDVAALNIAAGVASDDRRAPYQERWFPGVHGSVGGGGDIRGLSDDALAWVLAGAKAQGLKLDTARGTRLHSFMPDARAPLVNTANPEVSMTGLIKDDRDGPEHVGQVAESAKRRWRTPADKLGGKPYRPGALARVARQLDALGPWNFQPPTDLVTTETVREGDTLSDYAVKHYGAGKHWREIFAANEDVLDDADELFPGQKVRIPRLAPSAGGKAG